MNTKILIVGLLISLFVVGGCSQKELKGFAKDVAHNVGCDQRYEHQHKEHQLKGDCLRDRP